MKQKKIPMRTCVVTREQFEKKDLIRVVKNNEGNVFVDETGKANGRGAYIKKDLEVLEKAKKTKALDKHLETTISEEIYEELKNIIER
ncbi:MAG: YlxR family protein [Bacilli bacterium]|nr:YlxR family protein [Bacilli bacterium]